MKKLVIIFSCFVCMSSVFAQITLTYTGKSNLNTYVQPHQPLIIEQMRLMVETILLVLSCIFSLFYFSFTESFGTIASNNNESASR